MTMVRGEVITAVERRRRWSREEKEQLVAASFEPGVTVSAIARSAGMHASQLFRWRKELCQRSDASEPRFLPVEVVPTEVSAAPQAPAPVRRAGRPRKSSPIEIEIGGCRVRVDPDVDPHALRRVLDVLVRR